MFSTGGALRDEKTQRPPSVAPERARTPRMSGPHPKHKVFARLAKVSGHDVKRVARWSIARVTLSVSIGTRHRGDAEKHDERKQDGAEKAKDSQGDHGRPRSYALAANLARPLFSYPACLRPSSRSG